MDYRPRVELCPNLLIQFHQWSLNKGNFKSSNLLSGIFIPNMRTHLCFKTNSVEISGCLLSLLRGSNLVNHGATQNQSRTFAINRWIPSTTQCIKPPPLYSHTTNWSTFNKFKRLSERLHFWNSSAQSFTSPNFLRQKRLNIEILSICKQYCRIGKPTRTSEISNPKSLESSDNGSTKPLSWGI